MTKTVARAYYNVQAHIEHGEDLAAISGRTKKAVAEEIKGQIEAYKTMPDTWDFGMGAEYKKFVATLEKMLSVVATL